MAGVAASAPRFPFAPNWTARLCYLALVLYCIYAINALEISWDRVAVGLGIGGRFVADMFPPNFQRYELLIGDMLETLQISIISALSAKLQGG